MTCGGFDPAQIHLPRRIISASDKTMGRLFVISGRPAKRFPERLAAQILDSTAIKLVHFGLK
jgi:hypothetical protein